MQMMKLRTSRKLKNIILSIMFAILTVFKVVCPIFCKNVRVGSYENLFICWKAIKIAGSAEKNTVGRISGNKGIV